MTAPVIEPLTRAALAQRTGTLADAAPIRIVHFGLGAFHRAHQAWYTDRAIDAAEWGIAAFTGRSADMAETLSAQDGLYALVERSAAGDRVEVITSITEAIDGSRVDRLVELLSTSAVAVVTLTITEAGYRLHPDGTPDLDDPAVAADLDILRGETTDAAPATILGRLLLALDARHRADAGPLAIVPCDNIPRNGHVLEVGLTALAARVSAELAEWVAGQVSFVSTSVDRITPRAASEIDAVRAAGWLDRASVVTEPFSDWVLAGGFPAGRPAWETAGARFVDDIEPWENRKLWLLNGAHSILAWAGLRRGFGTVSEAIADPECRALVGQFWAEAVACLGNEVEHEEYRRQLVQRFENPRIEHALRQIAADGTTKARYRFAAVAARSLAAGRDAAGSAAAIAEWIAALQSGITAPDSQAEALQACLHAPDPVLAVVALLSPDLAETSFPAAVRRVIRSRSSLIPSTAH